MRRIIRSADPDIVETWKWRGVPVWKRSGIICTGETNKSVVKLTFATVVPTLSSLVSGIGYRGDAEATAQTIDQEGRLRIGDMGGLTSPS